ncbi:MAG: polyprenyl synthetase family protein [Planctomycetes bacterium]|nr:polyprenyl synthetase family protein [Planctomycetota bacterium]
MSATSTPSAFVAFVATWAEPVEAALRALLPSPSTAPSRLHEAMHYALFPGGKRLRPMLALLGCQAAGGDPRRALRAAAALECLHTYSLVHDDLPCMDDDDLRRGRPTCHKVYGEALALLAGDALLTVAFEGVADAGPLAVVALARASGSLGMVGGQVEDLAAEGDATHHTLERVRWIHDHKTGALITASLLVGAHAACPDGAPTALLEPLTQFGDLLGRAFQIADDCLDLTGTAAELGKSPLADVALGKLTWPAMVGLEKSLAEAHELAAAAAGVVPELIARTRSFRGGGGSMLDAAAGLLQDVASYAVARRR